jgi:hypothetical protein
MNKYLIRFNKSRGKPGRGTLEHAWRIFENDKEYIVKHFKINSLECQDEISDNDQGNDDWNICCYGYMTIDRETSTAIIKNYPPTCECNPIK